MNALLDTLGRWRSARVLVVGDFMLDQLVYGDAERLTADAPVPVLDVRRTEAIPGGAANVCADLAAMRCSVTAFGVRGDDPEGRQLADALAAQGVDASGLVIDPGRPTTVKRSLIGLAQHRHPQKMFRLDFESREPLAPRVIDELLQRFDAALADADIVAIEDYNKGVCAPALLSAIIERCRAAGKETLVDPAAIADYSKYAGCSAITPNRSEAELATGLSTSGVPAGTSVDTKHGAKGGAGGEHAAALARRLQRDLACDAIVLTLDKDGALLLEAESNPLAVPTRARQVYDVTGAGDMVLAALAAGRANGLAWPDAVRLANIAAGLEVEVFGVKPMPLETIHNAALEEARGLSGKRRTLDEAVVMVNAARREGRAVVFTNGCFDIIHAGHIALLRRAKAFGDLLVVGLNSDASVRRLKGDDRPVQSESDRADVLSEFESVGAVVLFDEDTPLRLIEALTPDVLVKGADYTKDRVVGADIVEAAGGRVELVELVEGRSTTSAIERMRGV